MSNLDKMKDPKIFKNIFSEKDFKKLESYFLNRKKLETEYDNSYGRYCFSDPILSEYSDKILPLVREFFEDNSILPSYSLFAHYCGDNAKLLKHKDNNACTYTIDFCTYQKDPWDLWVEDKPYKLMPNEALAYYGNDNIHWRKNFPNPKSNFVGMIFFHFVKPDHWWYTKGPDYLNVIKKQISENEWQQKNKTKRDKMSNRKMVNVY